jgi:hypothetical protein
VSTGVEKELTAAFESASDFVQPPASLAERVRTGARMRRRRAFAAAAACAAVIAIAGATYAVVGRGHHTVTVQQRLHGYRRIVIHDVAVEGVSGKYLYAYTRIGKSSGLAAYDRTTGKLVRRVKLPPEPTSYLTVGPGGLVWIAFDDSFALHAEPALWLLSPDLRLHSALAGFQAASVLPVTRTSAWITDPYLPHLGLLRVHMPAPGHSGTASAVSEPDTSLGGDVVLTPALGGWTAKLGGRIAVIVDAAPIGGDGYLVLAGSPSLRFGDSPRTQVAAMTSTGNALWVVTTPQGSASYQGPLVRLNARLRPTTPASVLASPVLARSEDVWSAGHTIWVATGAPGHSLVCFTAGSRIGRLTTLPVHGEVLSLAATSTTVYVFAEPPGSQAPEPTVSYPVPASCR